MHSIVLGTCQQLPVLTGNTCLSVVAVALQTAYYSDTHSRRQVGVFAVGLLATTPARVSEYVDVGCPERQASVALDVVLTTSFGILGAGFVTGSSESLIYQVVVESGCHGHRDGEHRSNAITTYAVQCLVPPVELGNAQAWDSRRGVHHQHNFLVQRQAAQ